MNKPIRRLAIFCMALLGVLMLNATYIQAIKAESLRNHPLNGRNAVQRLEQDRGPILAGNETIAFSEKIKDSEKYQRKYDPGGLYAHTTGFFSKFNETGIEGTHDSLLSGEDSRLFVRNFLDMVMGEKSQGASVQLTIDPKVQKAAKEALESTGKNGAVVALDPSTGAILASVSLPTYDPNSVSSIENVEDAVSNYEELEADEGKPLLNRALQQTYPPGSTFKVVTATAALENGATPESTQPDPAVMQMPAGGELPNWQGAQCGPGPTDPLGHSIEVSCNTSMASWAVDLGEEKMAEQAEKFGFNTGSFKTPLPVAESVYPTGMNGSQLAQTGIGQFSVRATPLQMAMVASAVANDGELMKPYLVEEVKGPDLSTIEEANPEVFSEAMSSDSAEAMTQMMIRVTEGAEASGPKGAMPGMQVAGKTGTAETGVGNPTHNWFISFAPADDPEVALAIFIEGGNQSGGSLAAPLSKQVMEAVFAE